MPELHDLNAAKLSTGFAAGEFSPLEVVDALLARIAARDPGVNAFCLIDPETTRQQAIASQARWRQGAPLSPLDGVPVAIKDLLLTRGWPTLRGSRSIDPGQDWKEDAPAVARLREAGAVLLGKTTTPDFGWKGVTDSPLTGITRNPWNLAKTPGGSSGGSAAALAARLAPLAIGTDGGGSVRIPAGFSGVFGLKPTYGRVPAYPLSPFGTLAHIGPMSRDVEGSALLLDVIAGFDPRDPHALAPPSSSFVDALAEGVHGKRIAFSPALGFAKVDAEIAALVADAARRFSDLGAIVEQADPPPCHSKDGDPKQMFHDLWWAGAGYLLGAASEETKALLDPGLRAMAEEGAALSLRRVQEATQARGAYASAMRVFMAKYDFLLTPTMPIAAFDAGYLSPLPEDGFAWLSWSPFCLPFNLTQQPAASVPCGFTRDGLPVGLQIVGRLYDDAGVLAAAKAYEDADPHYAKAPKDFT